MNYIQNFEKVLCIGDLSNSNHLGGTKKKVI